MTSVWRKESLSALHRIAVLSLICSFASSQVASRVSSSPQNDSGTFVVRIDVNLVQVDAVVTDSKGKLVTDLKAEDFEVLQDGTAQTISNFSYISEGVRPPATVPVPTKSVPLAS